MSAIAAIFGAAVVGFAGYSLGYNTKHKELEQRIIQLEGVVYELQDAVRLLRAENAELRRQLNEALASLNEVLTFLRSIAQVAQTPQVTRKSYNSYR